MKTELIISLKVEDCKKILADLTLLKLNQTNNLNVETFLLFNKIKGMCCSYHEVEE